MNQFMYQLGQMVKRSGDDPKVTTADGVYFPAPKPPTQAQTANRELNRTWVNKGIISPTNRAVSTNAVPTKIPMTREQTKAPANIGKRLPSLNTGGKK